MLSQCQYIFDIDLFLSVFSGEKKWVLTLVFSRQIWYNSWGMYTFGESNCEYKEEMFKILLSMGDFS